MNDFIILKQRCENECFIFLCENMHKPKEQALHAFIQQDEMVQEIIHQMIGYIVYEMPLKYLLLQTMKNYARKQGNDA